MGKSLTELMSASISNAIVAQRAWDGIIVLANNYGAEPGKDSTAAIQKAINDAKEKGKSEVYFQPGAYSYTSLSGTDGIVFVGDGVTVTGGTPTIPVVSTAQLADIAINVKSLGGGTGEKDDADVIQQAIDTVSARGGGDVFFPPGTYLSSKALRLKSNVRLVGCGYNSWLKADDWQEATFAFVYADRQDGPYQNIAVENLRITGALNGSVPSHSNQGAAVLIADADGVILRNLWVDQADDACIRLEGYNKETTFPIVNFNPDTNDELGHIHNALIEKCVCTGGYMGIEMEGGASGTIRGCDITISGNNGYALRIPIGRDIFVEGNVFHSLDDDAVWINHGYRVKISMNEIKTDQPNTIAHAINLGNIEDVLITSNHIYGSVTDGSFLSAPVTGALSIKGNFAYDRIGIFFNQKFDISNNEVFSGGIRIFNTHPKGSITGNKTSSLTIDNSSVLTINGGNVYIAGNYDLNGKPYSTNGNIPLLGSSSSYESSATYRAGDILINPAAGQASPFIRVCSVAGSPGTWLDGVDLRPGNYKDFFIRGNATNVSGLAIAKLTIPNEHVFLAIEVFLCVSRQPSSAAGKSAVAKQMFAIGRVQNSDVVVEALSSAGEFEVQTTTTGGGNDAGLPGLSIARGGSEASTAAQLVEIRADITDGFRHYNGVVRILGTLSGVVLSQ